MPNVMVALPNVGGALPSTPQSLTNAHYQKFLAALLHGILDQNAVQ